MLCKKCGSKMKVKQTWPINDHERKRLMVCKKCGHSETSTEIMDSFTDKKYVIKRRYADNLS